MQRAADLYIGTHDFSAFCGNKKMKKSSFVLGGIKNTKLDCMILAMHGENGEDGIAAALMRFYKIKYILLYYLTLVYCTCRMK